MRSMSNQRKHLRPLEGHPGVGTSASSTPVYMSVSAHAPEATPLARSLILVDAENLLGTPVFTAGQAAILRRRVEMLASYRPGDTVVISSSHMSAGQLWVGWGDGPRRLVRSGPDGADLELMSVLQCERVHERFDRVVVASGDGIFAPECTRLQILGCAVTVIAANRRSLSNALRMATLDVRLIDGVDVSESVDYAMGPAA